jgi:RNA-splicing ligase RtcB
MIRLKGHYGTAIVYHDTVEDTAADQIRGLLDTRLAIDADIRIMPDVHAGAGCVIGTTMRINDAVCPNLVGVDIGCGVLATQLGAVSLDLVALDRFVRKKIPSGFDVRSKDKGRHGLADSIALEDLGFTSKATVDIDKVYRSIGTLGGGNHFIEVAVDVAGCAWLVVHSGSRNIGLQTANHYQNLAQRSCTDKVPDDLKYLTGEAKDAYLHDMGIMQRFAELNREAMTADILDFLQMRGGQQIQTTHNYIDHDTMTLRKGSVRANADEQFIVPLNMADGSLICVGKGNAQWNHSAPHGAGRILSRTQARKRLSMDEFDKRMVGIYSTSVYPETLDEAPMAYKDGSIIERLIEPTATIIERLKPIYSFKAHSGGGRRTNRR